MSSGKNSRWLLRIGLWLVTAAASVAAATGAIMILFADKPVKMLMWEDIVTTCVGIWMLACVPVSLMRWVAVPEARFERMLVGPLAGMAVGGVSLIVPVLSEGRIDPAFAFGLVLILFVAQVVVALVMNRKADEMMRRYNSDSTALSSALLLGAFSIYAAGERLGVIGAISRWGLVGIACLIQFAVAMYVYYRLGMNPGAQEKAAAG